MLFQQVLNPDLGCASYVVADGGEAAVVDPQLNIEPYLRLADEWGVRIAWVIDTHMHADHVSGAARLVRRTGATYAVSPAADAALPHEQLHDGGTLRLGTVEIAALSTPGHRPEHLALVVSDRSRSARPWLVLAGDSLLVGDVARPDLAVSTASEVAAAAAELRRSLQRLFALGDDVELWPGHVGGSLCGSATTSRKPSSTLGFERRANPVAELDEDGFVREVVATLGLRPANVEHVVGLNRSPGGGETSEPRRLTPEQVQELLTVGVPLVDGRDAREFAAGHVRGALNVPLAAGSVGSRAGWLLDPTAPVIVSAGGDAEAVDLARRLAAVGFGKVLGLLDGGFHAWQRVGLPSATTRTVDGDELVQELAAGAVTLVDVRDADEWAQGHVPGSAHLPWWRSGNPASTEVDLDRPLVVACRTGARSAVAASALRRRGARDVRLLGIGIPELAGHGVELEAGAAAADREPVHH